MLEEKTVVELKEMLKERGLKVSGKKAELVERIQEFDQAIENYNETEDILVGHGAMYDYIAKNITEEVMGATGGDFMRSRIEDVVKADDGRDLISYMVEDIESLLDFYMEGGNEHTKSEIAEVRQFLDFLKNLANHVEVKAVGGKASEPIESDVPAHESKAHEDKQDVTEPAHEQDVPSFNFEGRTDVGKAIIEGIKAGAYTKATHGTITFFTIDDQICSYAGYDGITVEVEDGRIIEVYFTHRGAYSDVIVKGDELSRL